MGPFEASYGKKCRTPMTWDNLVNIIVLCPKFLKEMEHEIANIRKAKIDIKSMHIRMECIDNSMLGIMFILE